MIAWIKIAFRNLIKNRRRSAITAISIAFGFAAVNLFSGFAEYMYTGNRITAIFGKADGHLTIFKKGYLESGQLDPARYLLTPEEINAVNQICRKIPHVNLVAPQLMISGLVTNGKVSTIFIAQGVVPSDVNVFLDKIDVAYMKKMIKDQFEGKALEDDKLYGVGMARGLARLLDLKIGSDAVAFSTTVDGQMNALDLEVFQLFDTATSRLNDKAMRVPLSFARALYDTKGADRLVILLDKTKNTLLVRELLQNQFLNQNLQLEVKTWEQMNQWYRKVKNLFDVVFAFLFTIVFIIVVMSVVNTMGMAVIERTREIGTLRALGLKRKGVILLFSIESVLLGSLGAAGGLLLTFLGKWIVDIMKITWSPPDTVGRIPIKIELVIDHMLYSFIFLMILSVIASFIPAKRGSRENIVDALGHV
jgi:putative ABC transport system permease protein